MEQLDAPSAVGLPRQRGRAARKPVPAAQPVGRRLRQRRDLLASTALGASTVLLLAFPAAAQPAPTARPQGGAVVAGSASISQTASRTAVTQTSQRAAVDWRSFDVGRDHAVAFQQPNAASVTLNRVTGPDPSQIAGRIQANGQVVIVNGSGVVFHAGSQVDAQSLVVSAANVTNQNFMAGRMVFDRPGRPDARISNAGAITVGATGLAALVAPQVANSGTITARMGRVVLAGAEAHTVDLYGDGLMSVDVTREVRRAPGGGTALVTNTGLIQADGGTIELTAKAADGIVQNLVSAGGRLQANTAGGRPGTIVVSGIGGSIMVEGPVRADGRAPGATGGTVVLAATDTVAIGLAARVTANGRGGGGTVAVGTTAARARMQGGGVPDDASRAVLVAAGARIGADGRGTGSGGQVALLSTQRTVMAGRLTARGGQRGGDGGGVEISGAHGLRITGTVDTTAPAGRSGTLTIDPTTLTIGGTGVDDPIVPLNPLTNSNVDPLVYDNLTTQNISAATFNGFKGNVVLTAATQISVVGGGAPLKLASTDSVTLSSPGGAITVSAPLTAGNITVDGKTVSVGAQLTASTNLKLTASTAAGGLLDLSGGASGAAVSLSGAAISIAGPVVASGTLTLSGGTVTQSGPGVVTVGTLTGTTAGAVLLAGPNHIANLGDFTTGGQALTLGNAGSLNLSGTVSAGPAGTVKITATAGGGGIGDVTQSAGTLTAGTLLGSAAGSVSLASAGNAVSNVGDFSTGGSFTLNTGGPLALSGILTAGQTVNLTASGPLTQTAGQLAAKQLVADIAGGVTLEQPLNAVTSLGVATTYGNPFSLRNNAPLSLDGTLTAAGSTVTLNVRGVTQKDAAPITAGTLNVVSTSFILLTSLGNAIDQLGTVSAASSSAAVTNGGALRLAGNIDVGGNGLNLVVRAGDLTQDAAAGITAGTLQGSVPFGQAALGSSQNRIASLGAFDTATGFSLANGAVSLRVTGPVTAAAGSVALRNGTSFPQTTDSIRVSGAISAPTGVVSLQTGTLVPDGGTLRAPRVELLIDRVGGTGSLAGGGAAVPVLAIGPRTAGKAVQVSDALPGGADGLALTNAQLLALAGPGAAALQIGTTQPIQGALVPAGSASSITLSGPLDLASRGVGSLGLFAVGDVVQGASGALTVPSVNGAAGGSFVLQGGAVPGTPYFNTGYGNVIGAVGQVSAAGTLAVATKTGLAVTGSLSAPGGAITLTSLGVLSLNAPVGTGTEALTLQGRAGIAQTAPFNAASLQGQAGVDLPTAGAVNADLSNSGNRVATLNSFAANQGAFNLAAGTPLTVQGRVTAGTVGVTASSIAVPGEIGGGTVALAATAGNVASTGTIGAQTSLQLIGPNQAQVSAGAINAPSITVAGGLGILGGQVIGDAVTVLGGPTTMTGGTLHAGNLVTDGSAVATVGFSNGDLYAGNSLSVALAPVTAGRIATRGSLTATAGSLLTTTEFRAQGNAVISAAGDVQLAGGLIAAGGDATILAGGGIGQDTSSQIAAGGVLRLQGNGGGSRAIQGVLSGNQVQVIEPGLDLLLSPSALGGAAASSVGVLTNTVHVPGLDTKVSSSTYDAALNPGAARPAELRADGRTITLGTVAANQVELNSTGDTVARGTVTAVELRGFAGAGSVTFAGANDVQQLGNYQARNGFTLNDAPGAAGLTVTGVVRSGIASDSLSASSATASPLAITLSGPGATLAISPTGVLAGSVVSLAASGPVVEAPGGRIVANQLSVDAASLSLPGQNSIASLGTVASPGGILLNDPGAALTLTSPLKAAGGTISLTVGSLQQTQDGIITAGTLTGSTTGRTDLTGASNAIANLGGFTTGGDFALNSGGTALRITGALDAGANAVTLNAGSLQQSAAGSITAGSLSGSTLGIADLGGATNAVGALGGFGSGGSFSLNDGQTALTLNGPLNAGANAVSLRAGSLQQAAPGVITADRLLLDVTGRTDLTAAANAVRTLGAISTNSDFGLNDGGTALTLTGPVNVGGNTLTLQAGSLAQLDTATITAGRLQGGTTGATSLGAVANTVGALGPFVSGGDFALNNGSNALLLAGPLNAGSNQVTLTTGLLRQVTTRNPATGEVTSGSITAGTLTGSANGAAELGSAVNAVQALGAFTARGSFTLNNDGTALILTGRLNAAGNQAIISAASLSQTAGGGITASSLSGFVTGGTDLSAAANSVGTLGSFVGGGDLRFNNGAQALALGNIAVGANTLVLTAGSLAQQPAGTIIAGTLSGATAGATSLGGVGNQVSQLGRFTSGGDFSLVNAPNLSVTGPVQAGARTITLVNGGNVILAGGGSLAGGTVVVQTPGTFVERGGTLAAGVLTVAARQFDAGSTGNAVDVLGAVSAQDGVRLENGRSLAAIGAIRADNGLVSLRAEGDLTVNAALAAGSGVRLEAARQLTLGPASAVSGASVLIASDGATTLAGTVFSGGPVTVGANGLQVLGRVTGGAVSLDGGTGAFALAPAGTVSGSGVALTAAGPAFVDGQVSAPGAVTVRSNGMGVTGTILSTAGSVGLNGGRGEIALAGVIGAADRVVMQTDGAARLGGRVVAGNSLSVRAGTTATLAGGEAAPLITIVAPAIRLEGGTITTAGAAQPTGTRQSALPTAATAAAGAFFQAGSSFTQTGATTFAAAPGSSGSTIRVTLASGGGTATFGSLSAPASTLILDLGSGAATGGRISVGSLYLIYAAGGAGSADLQARVGGLEGNAAAASSTVFPFASRSYRINSCAVASVNCIVLTPQTVPVGNPLKELSLSFFREQDDDDQLIVPNVSDQGL